MPDDCQAFLCETHVVIGKDVKKTYIFIILKS